MSTPAVETGPAEAEVLQGADDSKVVEPGPSSRFDPGGDLTLGEVTQILRELYATVPEAAMVKVAEQAPTFFAHLLSNAKVEAEAADTVADPRPQEEAPA